MLFAVVIFATAFCTSGIESFYSRISEGIIHSPVQLFLCRHRLSRTQGFTSKIKSRATKGFEALGFGDRVWDAL